LHTTTKNKMLTDFIPEGNTNVKKLNVLKPDLAKFKHAIISS